MVKARLYRDMRKEHRDSIDAWSIYFPYPKWLKNKEHGLCGCFLSCKPTEYGMVQCEWFEDKISQRAFLGKKINPKTTPRAFQKIFRKLESAFNNAITKNTKAAWDAWNRV